MWFWGKHITVMNYKFVGLPNLSWASNALHLIRIKTNTRKRRGRLIRLNSIINSIRMHLMRLLIVGELIRVRQRFVKCVMIINKFLKMLMQIKQPVKAFSFFYSSHRCKSTCLNVFLMFWRRFIKSHNFQNLTWFPLSWKTKY